MDERPDERQGITSRYDHESKARQPQEKAVRDHGQSNPSHFDFARYNWATGKRFDFPSDSLLLFPINAGYQ
jgi:hypothetical protein